MIRLALAAPAVHIRAGMNNIPPPTQPVTRRRILRITVISGQGR